MKAKLIPVYFPIGRDADFDTQLARLKTMFAEEAVFLPAEPLGANLPDCDAVVFPQFLGEAYSKIILFQKISVPILVITSEFGTFSMWDWEILGYMRSKGIFPFAPSNLAQAKIILRSLSLKRDMLDTKFVVYQDDPADSSGMQSDIFKRFFWWEDESEQRLKQKFGIALERKSYKKLAETAQKIPDSQASQELKTKTFKRENVKEKQLLSAMKTYIALKDELDKDDKIRSVGINCLNESRFSDTTPCLAWNLLFSERKLIWGCEGDHLSMLTKYLIFKSLNIQVMMTNLYPFLMGQAALKHERIPDFPDTDSPENHILAAHCGYFGVCPEEFCSSWCLKSKVLKIVNDNAIAIDARFKEGDITLVKISPTFESMTVVEGRIEKYVQYENSDCLNGAVIRVKNGRKLVDNLISHHYIIAQGHIQADLAMVLRLFDINVDTMD